MADLVAQEETMETTKIDSVPVEIVEQETGNEKVSENDEAGNKTENSEPAASDNAKDSPPEEETMKENEVEAELPGNASQPTKEEEGNATQSNEVEAELPGNASQPTKEEKGNATQSNEVEAKMNEQSDIKPDEQDGSSGMRQDNTADTEGVTEEQEVEPVNVEGDHPQGDPPTAELGDLSEKPSEMPPAEMESAPSPSREGLGKRETTEDLLEDEMVEEEFVYTREDMLAKLKEALTMQESLKSRNALYQHKIADYLAKKKTEEKHDPSKSVTDQEQRYLKCMYALEGLQHEFADMQEKYIEGERELVVESEVNLDLVAKKRAEYVLHCKQKSLEAVHSRTGRRLAGQEFNELMAEDKMMEQEVVQARLENIRLATNIQKKEQLVRQKEELGGGLHVIDFEQLKIDNVNLNEKIEERNEELTKLRKKIMGTVQVLTHVKEKLQFVQAENEEQKSNLINLEQQVAKKRNHLTRLKQTRDGLRIDNINLRQQVGLIGHLDLLRDFEEQVDQNEEMLKDIEDTKMAYSQNVLACRKVKEKLQHADWIQRGVP